MFAQKFLFLFDSSFLNPQLPSTGPWTRNSKWPTSQLATATVSRSSNFLCTVHVRSLLTFTLLFSTFFLLLRSNAPKNRLIVSPKMGIVEPGQSILHRCGKVLSTTLRTLRIRSICTILPDWATLILTFYLIFRHFASESYWILSRCCVRSTRPLLTGS